MATHRLVDDNDRWTLTIHDARCLDDPCFSCEANRKEMERLSAAVRDSNHAADRQAAALAVLTGLCADHTMAGSPDDYARIAIAKGDATLARLAATAEGEVES